MAMAPLREPDRIKEDDLMTIDGLARAASTSDAVALLTFKKGLDQSAGQMAQLLQALPQAPQPAHLGNHVNVLA